MGDHLPLNSYVFSNAYVMPITKTLVIINLLHVAGVVSSSVTHMVKKASACLIRIVLFKEDVFPYLKTTSATPIITTTPINMPSTALEDEHISTLPSPENTSITPRTDLSSSTDPTTPVESETVQADTVLGRGCRTKKPSTRLTNFVINTVSLTPLTAHAPSSFLGMVYHIPN